MTIDRRTFLQTTAVLATLSGAGCASVDPTSQMAKGGAGKVNTAALKASADKILSAGVSSGDVPGVVAAATNREGMIYQGAFGSTVLGSGTPMTVDTVVWMPP